jgi:hypothetical protein
LADGDRNAGNSGARVSPSPYPRLVSNPCRFCGATNRQITKEHVWPDWLRDYLPPVSELHDIERYSPGTKRQRLPQPFLRTTVRAFCDGCNSGWMADIEAAAKPIVGPMVVGRAMDLDADAQQIVANWVALKGLVAAVTSNLEQEIPNSHYRHVHNFQGAPPDTMRVWVSRRRNLADAPTGRLHIFDFHFMPVSNKFRQFPIPPDVERYRREGGVFNGTIFQVGHFFALAFQHDWPGLRTYPKPGSEAVDALPPIWPIGPTVHWPPPKSIDDLGDPHKVIRFLQIAPPLAPVSGP